MAPKPKAIGLDDPRVHQCSDRGNNYYDADYPINRLDTEVRPLDADAKIFRTIRRELDAKIVKTEGNNYFIPRGRLREIFTPERLLAVIQQLWKDLPEQDQRKRCHRVLYELHCWKVFLLFIFTNTQQLLPRFWEEEIDEDDKRRLTDRCLPLKSIDNDSGLIKCQNKDHSHQFPDWEEADLSHCQLLSFEQASYALNAVYFKLPTKDKKNHVHYSLDTKDVLPYTIIPCAPSTNSRSVSGRTATTSKADDTNSKGETTTNDNPNGGFGEIIRVRIDPDHYSFDCLGRYDGENTPSFAVKKLYASDEDAFDKELASLTSIKRDEDVHLIKLLTTFCVGEGGRKTFYLVFPWAEGTLWDYWERNKLKDKQDRLDCTPWMAREIHEIARALQFVHNEREMHLKQYPDFPSGKRELYGRHGDIKADNILYFSGDNTLVISDFGLGRLQTKYSRSNNNPKALEKSATYRAPEFDLTDGRISRASDIFSLGCMYLEFVTWYLMGYDSVSNKFPEYRMEEDVAWGFESDTFFKIVEGEPIIKPKVQKWIARLRKHGDASAYTNQLLDTIQQMLAPVSAGRINIAKLTKYLELFRKTCEEDPSYYGAQLS